jgi:hypothetical protein
MTNEGFLQAKMDCNSLGYWSTFQVVVPLKSLQTAERKVFSITNGEHVNLSLLRKLKQHYWSLNPVSQDAVEGNAKVGNIWK